MHYVDTALSSVLFVLAVLSFFLRRFRTNIWCTVLALSLLPVSVYSYWFADFDRILFGNTTVKDAILYPFLKVLLILALAGFMGRRRTAK